MATLNEVQDSIDQMTVEFAVLKKNLAINTETINSIKNLRAEVAGALQRTTADTASEIRDAISQNEKITKAYLEKAVKALEQGKQENQKDWFTKTDVIAMAFCFIMGLLLMYGIIRNFTENMVIDLYNKQIQETAKTIAEEPRKKAESDAKLIIENAKNKAEEILKNTKNSIDKT